MEEYKVGEVFQFGKKKLKCVQGMKCSECAMSDLELDGCELMSHYLGACEKRDRSDHTGVMFIEVKEEDDGSVGK